MVIFQAYTTQQLCCIQISFFTTEMSQVCICVIWTNGGALHLISDNDEKCSKNETFLPVTKRFIILGLRVCGAVPYIINLHLQATL